jgi:hypothetical protein
MQQSFKLLGISHSAFLHQSSKKSHTNADIKRSSVLVPNGKRKTPEEVRISATLTEYKPPPKKKPKKNPLTAVSTDEKVKQFLLQFPPANGTHYDLKELVVGLLENDASPSIYTSPMKQVHDSLQKLGKVVCSRVTLQRRCKSYINDVVLPRAGDDGAAMGRRPLIAIENIPRLNERALEVVGMTQDSNDLVSSMQRLVAQDREERGLPQQTTSNPNFAHHTRARYDALASLQPGIARVNNSSARTQGIRRQMAKLSERNLLTNISTTVTFNFVRGEWVDKPDNLPEGCRLAYKLIEAVMGCPMLPVPSWQVFNYYMTSYYTFKGTSHRSGNGNEWSRVSNESLDRGMRSHTSIKKCGEESVCNGLTVRWMDSANACGELLPIVQIFEGFGEDIMPKDDYLFLEVPGLSVGSTTDARLSDAPGYVVFKKLGASMMPFHTWYNLTILAPYYKQVRKKHGYSSEDTELPEQEHARVYCDSDMTNIACLTNYTEMERNHKNGLAFAKFGSKTTDWCQPMDVGSGFKQKKQMAKFTTTEARDQRLEQTIRSFLESKHHRVSSCFKRVTENMRPSWSVLPLAHEFMVRPGSNKKWKRPLLMLVLSTESQKPAPISTR